MLEKASGNGSIRVGSKVIAGTVLSHVAKAGEGADPHINFSIRPAGKGAPRIDPKPILDGWKLLEATAIYRAKGKNPFNAQLSGAGVLLLSKEALQQRVLADKGLDIYQCGREDIEQGKIDRRVLAVLEYLRSKGFTLRISALKCGHSYLTESGNVSEHSTGDAVDIAEIDGVNVTGHQGPGTLVHQLIEDVLQLQGLDAAPPGDLARRLPRRNQLRRSVPLRPRPHRLPPGRSRNPLEASQGAAQTGPVGAPDRPPREDRKPEGADRPVEVLAARQPEELGREAILGGHPRGED